MIYFHKNILFGFMFVWYVYTQYRYMLMFTLATKSGDEKLRKQIDGGNIVINKFFGLLVWILALNFHYRMDDKNGENCKSDDCINAELVLEIILYWTAIMDFIGGCWIIWSYRVDIEKNMSLRISKILNYFVPSVKKDDNMTKLSSVPPPRVGENVVSNPVPIVGEEIHIGELVGNRDQLSRVNLSD